MSHKIQLKRRLAASADEVYEAWTDAHSLSQWMVPIVGGHTEAVVDARVGGKYRIDMFGLSGKSPQQGEYLRLERPRLIEFTWIADPAATQHSIVTVELTPVSANETDLTLTHRLLPSEVSAQNHQTGWDSGLDSLVAHVNHPKHKHYRSELHIRASASTLYAALSTQAGLRGWWTQSCTVGEKVGEAARFEFGEISKVMRVETLRPERQVRWRCLQSDIRIAGRDLPANEWAGTTIVFRLNSHTPTDTVLRFEHLGLTPALACYEICEAGWNQFLASLKSYTETGTGSPYLAQDTGQADSKAA